MNNDEIKDPEAIKRANASMDRLGKWRTIFAGWQLGTKPKGDPEGDAVRNNAEQMLLLRAEYSTVARLLVEKGITTREEFTILFGEECEALMRLLEKQFPGIKANDDGLIMDTEKARPWMSKWKP